VFERAVLWANLSNADMTGVRLTEASLSHADLSNTILEFVPAAGPYIFSMSLAKNLEKLKFLRNEGSLIELRNALSVAGLLKQASDVGYAIRATRVDQALKGGKWLVPFGYRAVFGWGCKYGAAPWRPIRIFLLGIPIFACFYGYFLSPEWKRGGIFVISTNEHHEKGKRIRNRLVCQNFRKKLLWGVWFSFMTAFGVGDSQRRIGGWISNLTPSESQLAAAGIPKFFVGIQSLLSMGLLTLWLLSLFSKIPDFSL
jgi:hypothetical protein